MAYSRKHFVVAGGLSYAVLAGVRDVILPGDMKDLMNKVIEARKAAEASVIISPRGSGRHAHQANAAKLLADNPTLLRSASWKTSRRSHPAGQLSVVLGEKGLAERCRQSIVTVSGDRRPKQFGLQIFLCESSIHLLVRIVRSL